MRRQQHKIQRDVSLPPPTSASGLSNSVATIGTNAASDTNLAIDPHAPHTSTHGATPALPTTTQEQELPTLSPSNESPPSSSNSANPIPIGTVIAVCVGALAGA